MAQIVKINSVTYREGINNVNNVVGVFEDTHVFDSGELEMFDIEKIPGTKAAIELQIGLVTPERKQIYKSDTIEWSDKEPETKVVWDDAGEWKELVEPPKYTISYTDKFEHNFNKSEANSLTMISITSTDIETSK